MVKKVDHCGALNRYPFYFLTARPIFIIVGIRNDTVPGHLT